MALTKLGKYERVDVLGHGATGIVYLAWDTLLKKQVALKEIDLHAADVNRFLEGARVMDRLRHPGIVRVNGVDQIDGQVVLDMEYIRGRNLQQLMRSESPLSIDRALSIAIQTLDALEYAHTMRTVHRDIKPANILVDQNDHVKLVDFGLAEILATNSYAGGAGTYAYMAPEDFAEEHHSDHQSDIWAVGITLYEMLTGARPFVVDRPKDPFSWRRTLLNDPPTLLEVHMERPPARLQAVMDRVLSVDKGGRYPSAGQFRDDLIAIREGKLPNGVDLNRTVTLPRITDTTGRSRELPPVYQQVVDVQVEEAKSPNSAHVLDRPAGRMSLLRRKESLPAVADADPPAVYFGEVRKGDVRSAKVKIRIKHGAGKLGGCVASAPGWAGVYPMRFDGRKRTLIVTANSDRVWQTGDFQEPLRLDTSGGTIEIPLAIRVLPARPTFSQVAVWFVPLFAAALLPALSIAFLGRFAEARYLVPAASLGSGMLAVMLLQVCAAADIGVEERIATGMVFLMMAVILGVVIGTRSGHTESLFPLVGTGVPFGTMVLVQLFTRKHWKAWAATIAILSLLATGTFISVLGAG
jgi:serine/threonine-protein kinase